MFYLMHTTNAMNIINLIVRIIEGLYCTRKIVVE